MCQQEKTCMSYVAMRNLLVNIIKQVNYLLLVSLFYVIKLSGSLI